MQRPDAEKLGHFAISSGHLANIAFGLTVDEVNELTLALMHAEAAVDLVRWYNDATVAIDALTRNRAQPSSSEQIAGPAELLEGTITTLLYRAVADIGSARKLTENAARIKAVRHGDEASE